MKKLLLTLLLAVVSVSAFCQVESDTLYAFIVDKTPTNVRSTPRGNVVLKLPTESSYIVELTTPRNGWWQVTYVEAAEEGTEVALSGSPTKQYWVHNSVVSLGTRNYGGQRITLHAKPSEKAKSVFSFNEEITLHPLEVKGEWVKVTTDDGRHVGWIQSEWLCSNPLTNCC